ncbi:hypothetical protein COV93_02015 [Candidatus Woesearchaeota archaeon CG11_big_fil_rev_8_21_14_0_20_43_8]|nr:MAG: hypothetical protein COV93_02015 [Candidatus Woesearchaeota archaeon CG11_big_fil_rev_8_21_14_0_20_43_8]PIO07052.1 MAG: hypothetical protein COT47_01705 [Candidatus Woesearchaeota archaeon CG08_land_8_20_14_0_20_43_7]
MKRSCIRCKGRLECGARFCPIEKKTKAFFNIKDSLKKDFSCASPNIFVGRYGYPDVNMGFLAPPEIKSDAASFYDDPVRWSDQMIGIGRVIDLRSSLVNSRFRISVKDVRNTKNRFLDMGQEIAMADRPVDIEINLAKTPSTNPRFDAILSPMGPFGMLKHARLTENPHIPRQIDKVTSDIDLKAVQAIKRLSGRFDEYDITKIFTAGVLGLKTERRLVPTRWAITAVDDIIGKQLIDEIMDFNEGGYKTYFGGHLGNYYLILMFPGPFRYELFETSLSGSVYNQGGMPGHVSDYEDHNGRKEYAYNTAGGYYAARLPLLERLKKDRLRCSVLVLRFITNEYYCPLGVWVVREAVKKALASEPFDFDDMERMLKYSEAMIKKRFGCDASILFKESRLLDQIKNQRRIYDFIS